LCYIFTKIKVIFKENDLTSTSTEKSESMEDYLRSLKINTDETQFTQYLILKSCSSVDAKSKK